MAVGVYLDHVDTEQPTWMKCLARRAGEFGPRSNVQPACLSRAFCMGVSFGAGPLAHLSHDEKRLQALFREQFHQPVVVSRFESD